MATRKYPNFMTLQSGMTLMELIVSMAIVAIVMSIAIPGYSSKVDQDRVSAAAEQIYQDLIFARSEAVKTNADITLSFVESSAWCYGINDSGVCNCATAGSCTIDSKDKTGSYESFANTSLAVSTSIKSSNFDPTRGVIEKAGAPVSGGITVTGSTVSATVNLNVLGRPSICSNNFSYYPSC